GRPSLSVRLTGLGRIKVSGSIFVIMPARGGPTRRFALGGGAHAMVFRIVVAYRLFVIVVVKVLVFLMPLRLGGVGFIDWFAHDFIPGTRGWMQAINCP